MRRLSTKTKKVKIWGWERGKVTDNATIQFRGQVKPGQKKIDRKKT